MSAGVVMPAAVTSLQRSSKAGELMRTRLDGVSGLVQELTDLADSPVDRLGPDIEHGRDDDLRQGEALVEGGGQEPVGEGEDGAAASAGGGQPWAVAAALIQAGFALLVMQRHQRGDQGIPLVDGQAGQGRVGQPGQVRAGPTGRVRGGIDLLLGLGAESVVPVTVPVVSAQRQDGHLSVADLGAGGIGPGAGFDVHAQPGAGGGGGMVRTMTSWLVSGRPRQFIVMAGNSRCPALFHLEMSGGIAMRAERTAA
jgi:hypothetical protein